MVCHQKSIQLLFKGTVAIVGALFVTQAVLATAVCVTTAEEFQAALTNAETATSPTTIEVTIGTYAIESTLTYDAATGNSKSLTIEGGFGALFGSPCAVRLSNPALTVLDGGNSVSILRLIGPGGGSIKIESMTFQHGLSTANDNSAAALFQVSEANDNVDIENNVFVANSLASSGDNVSVVHVETRGYVTLLNNAMVGNSLQHGSGFDLMTSPTLSTIFNNNTVSGNTCASEFGTNDGLYLVGGAQTTVENNILIDNLYCNDGVFAGSGSFTVAFNDLGNVDSAVESDGGNYDVHDNLSKVQPDFVGNGSYELAGNSPLVDSGDDSPIGGVGTVDAAGNSRIVAIRSATSTVDIGAYELQDDIFKNGFE